jgi:transcriptional regulator with XRE-family HTH domain
VHAVLLEEKLRVGRRVAEARRRAGFTQRELAEALGVTVRSIQLYESGSVIPYKHLRRIELLTRTRPGWILGENSDHDAALLLTLEGVREALRQHQELVAEHVEEMRRHTEQLREHRAVRERMRSSREAARQRPPAD